MEEALGKPLYNNSGRKGEDGQPGPAIFSDALVGALGSLKKETTWNLSAKLKDAASGTRVAVPGMWTHLI
jgi:hypothetical protein